MIINLYGPDSYRRLQKQKAIIEEKKAKDPFFTIKKFYFEEKDGFLKFEVFINNQSLFSKKRTGIIEKLPEEPKKDFKNLLKTILENKNTDLIISCDDKPAAEYNFLLKSPGIIHEFEMFSGNELLEFVKSELIKHKITADQNILRYLINVYQAGSWGLQTEIERLSLGGTFNMSYQYKSADNFFGYVTEIINNRAINSRLKALEILLDNEDPAKIFNFIAAVSRNKQKMADYDAMVKSGKLNYEETLLDFALS